MQFRVNDANRMEIMSTGRTGINNSNPDGRLDILGGAETALVVKTSASGEYGAIIQSVSTNRTPIFEVRKNDGNPAFQSRANGQNIAGNNTWGTLPQNAEDTLLVTENGACRLRVYAGENSSARDAVLDLKTKHSGAQQRIQFTTGDYAAGTMHGEIFHNQDGQTMTYTSGADSAADGQHTFRSGLGRGLNLNGGQLSFADDVERTYQGVNTGALIAIGYYADNNGARYHHGLFWASYGIGTSTVIVVGDPANRFRGTDTDGNMCCLSASGSGTFRVKNRLGVTTNVSINIIQMQGN